MYSYIIDGDLTAAKTAKTVQAKETPSTKSLNNPIIKIENIVVSAALHAEIDLYALSKNVKAVDYEPEQFPGAIFKVAEPKAV
ncbi:MAG: TATA-box-binding protein, partial [Candidatus Micrarchaeia archaeon]